MFFNVTITYAIVKNIVFAFFSDCIHYFCGKIL